MRVAVIGAGPAGAITMDALAREPRGSFERIRVFERQRAPGGCWLDDADQKGVSVVDAGNSSSPSQPQPQPPGPPDLGGVMVWVEEDDGDDDEINGESAKKGMKQVDLLEALAKREADRPRSDIPPASELPTRTRRRYGVDGSGSGGGGGGGAGASSARASEPWPPRFGESSIYPYLETNVDLETMRYSNGGGVEGGGAAAAEEDAIDSPEYPATARSVARHGADTPFRHWTAMRAYVERLVRRRGYDGDGDGDGGMVAYGVTVELAEKVRRKGGTGDEDDEEWRLVLRREERNDENGDGDGGEDVDYWWEERFDAVVVASGHFNVPYVPRVEGLAAFARARERGVMHSKQYRGREGFRGKVSPCSFVFSFSFSLFLLPSLSPPFSFSFSSLLPDTPAPCINAN